MFFKRSQPKPSRAYAIPEGQRVYAVGDIHGRADLLDQLIETIIEDDRQRGQAETSLIFLGDLVDRGPESSRVVDRVRELCEEQKVARLLKGNHEEVFIDAARGEPRAARALVSIGGMPTILSYGISKEEAEHGTYDDLARLLAERIPREHVRFLESAEDHIVIGDYLFVHAGVRPGVALDEQKPADLRWIRDTFIRNTRDHGYMVVHGHTITDDVENLANRVGIDTGAYASGVLSAVGLQGEDRWFLSARGSPGKGY